MYVSELIGRLLAELVANGDMDIKLEAVPQYETDIRGFYVITDQEFGTKTLLIEPVDR